MIEILLLQALVWQAGANSTQAMTTLERALNLAEPGGFVPIFVDEGPTMACLLYEALSRGIKPDCVRRLLAAFPITEPEQANLLQRHAAKSELVEPLSESELEVLQHIAEGLTKPECATRLFISLNTVKAHTRNVNGKLNAHTRNIYGKLDTHNRTVAVAKARALGVLHSA